MSSEELDQLFRNKLTGHEAEPSTHAWSKLEEQLKQKKSALIWKNWSMAIAASFLLAIGTWTLFINQQEPAIAVASNEEKQVLSDTLEQANGQKADSLSQPEWKEEYPAPVQNQPAPKSIRQPKPIHQHKPLLASQPQQPVENLQKPEIKTPEPIAYELKAIPQTDSLDKQKPEVELVTGITVTLALNEAPTAVQEIQKPKEKPLKTLFKQLKALKKGEEVSFKELKNTGELLIAGSLKTNEEE